MSCNINIFTAQAKNSTLPLTEATQHIFTEAIKQGYGDDHITGIAQLYI